MDVDNEATTTQTARRSGGPRRPHRSASMNAGTQGRNGTGTTTKGPSAKQFSDSDSDSEEEYTTTQSPPPVGKATSLGNGTVEWSAFGQTVYVRDATKHPPGASFAVALVIGFACLLAVIWQMVTTYNAFSNLIFDGNIWMQLTRSAQDAARLSVEIICTLIAISFQAPLLFFAFKVDKHFATTRHLRLSMAAKIAVIWEGMKEIVASNMLLAIWTVIALFADSIGDIGFLSSYSDSSVVLFFYATGLYGLSTIGLSESLQILWDGMVTSEWLKHVRAANAWAMLKAQEMANQKQANKKGTNV